jgi:hypothetical protein
LSERNETVTHARKVLVKKAVADLEAAMGGHHVDRAEVAQLAGAVRRALDTGPNDGSLLERRAWRRIGEAEDLVAPHAALG